MPSSTHQHSGIIKRIMQLYIEEFAQCLQTMTRDTKHQREMNSGEKAQRQ